MNGRRVATEAPRVDEGMIDDEDHYRPRVANVQRRQNVDHAPESQGLGAFKSLLHVFLADPQPQRLDISKMAASNADPSVGMIIGAAAGVSSLLILATIFIGYWILKRRERVRTADTEAPRPEAPRKAGRHSIVLSLGTPSISGSSESTATPSTYMKELPTPMDVDISNPQLLSSNAFAVTPMTATFPRFSIALSPENEKPAYTWPDPEKGPVHKFGRASPAMTTAIPPSTHPPARLSKEEPLRLHMVRRPPPINVQQAQTMHVEQAIDSGLRMVDVDSRVYVPPPYTPR